MATLKKKTNYVPKRNIKSITVKRGNKTTEIDGKNLFDGAYVKKGVKFKDGGSMKVGDKKVYNKLVGRKGNEYYFLNYVFKHENDFMGAVGTIVTPVNKEYYEYATSRDGLAERFLNAMSESEWCNTLGLDEDNCTEEEIIDGIENLYRVGELQPFEECNSTQESQMREIAQFSDSNEYPLFEVIGGGRSFDKNQKFDKVYDKGLLELIKKAESNKLAKGGSMYRTGGNVGYAWLVKWHEPNDEGKMQDILSNEMIMSDADDKAKNILNKAKMGQIINEDDVDINGYAVSYKKVPIPKGKKTDAYGFEYAKGGSMYRTGGVAGSKHVDVTKGYRLEHGYKAIKGDDKNKDYSKGKGKVKVTRGYRLPSGYEVREGAYNKKYEDGGNANYYCYEIGGL